MPNEYLGGAIASGLQQVAQYQREQPERNLRLREAEARAKQADLALSDYEANKPVREAQRSNELAQLESQTYQLNANLAKQQTYDAFKMYGADKDTRHLNNWLASTRSNPVASSMFSGMLRVDDIQDTPEVRQMLVGQGIKDVDGLLADKDLRSQFVLGTDASGQHKLVEMNKLYAVTGYAQYATDESRKQLASNAILMQQLRAGGNLADIRADDAVVGQLAEQMGLPRDEVFRMLKEQPSASQGRPGSAVERVAEQLRKDNPELSYRDSLTQAITLTTKPSGAKPTNEAAFIEQYMADNEGSTREDALAAYRQAGRDERTSKQKDTEYAEEAKNMLDEKFGGNFLDADVSTLDTKQQAEVAQYLNRIEQVGGLELSLEEKKNARSFRKLMGVAKTAGENLTAEQTGPIDSILRSVKSYISDEVDGKEASVAYESFRAIARNALFGSQVSGADYKAFNSAFASLGMQTGPVLVSLKTQLSMLKDDMEAMADLNDPYVVKARFGTSIDELDNIANAIQDRIDIIDAVQKGKPIEGINLPADNGKGSGIRVNVDKPQGSKPPLSEIFGAQ